MVGKQHYYYFQRRGKYGILPKTEAFQLGPASHSCTKLGRDVTPCYITNPCNPDYFSCRSNSLGVISTRGRLLLSTMLGLLVVVSCSKEKKHEGNRNKRSEEKKGKESEPFPPLAIIYAFMRNLNTQKRTFHAK